MGRAAAAGRGWGGWGAGVGTISAVPALSAVLSPSQGLDNDVT